MGTNYYAEVDLCDSCGRSDTLHIGKSSGGWKFSFAAYENPPIWSWSEWERFLESKDARIEDEYGNDVSLYDLKALVEKKFAESGCQTCWVENHGTTGNNFHDPEGHPFYVGEFS